MTTITTLKGEHEAFIGTFLRQVRCDHEISSSGYRVAAEIAEHLNRRSRTAWPCQARLVANTGLSEATVKRALGLLRRRGYIDVEPGEGRRSTVYRLLIVDREDSSANPLNRRATGSERTPQRVHQRPLRGFDDEPRPYEGPSEGTPKASPDEERENAQARKAPQTDARAPVGAASEGKIKRAGARPAANAERRREGARRSGRAKPRRAEASFLELQAAYPRPWVDDDLGQAWLEYDRAIREVDSSVILDAARRWTVAADAPRFLQSLCRWLQGRCWEREPPAPNRRGPEKARPRPSTPRYRGKPDIAAIVLAEAAAMKAARAGL